MVDGCCHASFRKKKLASTYCCRLPGTMFGRYPWLPNERVQMAGGSTFGFNSNPLPTRGPRNTILHSNIFEYQVPGTGTWYLVNKNEAPASPNPTTCPRNGRQQNLIGCARGSTLASTPQPLQQQNRVSRASLPPSHPQRTCHMNEEQRTGKTKILLEHKTHVPISYTQKKMWGPCAVHV